MMAAAKVVHPVHDFTVSTAKIDHLRSLGFSNDEIHQLVAPRRTLTRRIQDGSLLSLDESDRVLRLERISEMADRVFGNRDKAHRWLRDVSRVLNARPIDMLRSETGARLVEEELHRIDYGIYV